MLRAGQAEAGAVKKSSCGAAVPLSLYDQLSDRAYWGKGGKEPHSPSRAFGWSWRPPSVFEGGRRTVSPPQSAAQPRSRERCRQYAP